MNNAQGDLALHAPVLDNNSLEGPANRAKLLRAWIEISAWLADFTKRYGLSLRLPEINLGYLRCFLPLSASNGTRRSSQGQDLGQDRFRSRIIPDCDWRTSGTTSAF